MKSLKPSPRWLLGIGVEMSAVAHARNLISPILSRTYRLSISGAHHLPRHGGVLVIAEQHGLLDSTILASGLPRPVRVLMQSSDARPRLPVISQALGRITIDANKSVWSPLAQARQALEQGEAVGVFSYSPFDGDVISPPTAIAAYLQARTAVPVIVVTMFDTAGKRPTDFPRPRSILECHIAPPAQIQVPEDPLSISHLRQQAEAIRQVVADAGDRARMRTGRIRGVTEPHNGDRD